MSELTKICNRCKIEKQLTEFYKRSNGVRHICIECQEEELDEREEEWNKQDWEDEELNLIHNWDWLLDD